MMYIQKRLSILLVALLVLSVGMGPALARDNGQEIPQAALGSAFTYQGQLKDGSGNPVTAVCDIRFGLWDAESAGTQIGNLSIASNIQVANGYFTAWVNESGEFGASAFTGQARWLEVSVRCPAVSGAYTPLTPRQALTMAPYAAYAQSVGVHSHWGDTWSGTGTGLTLSGGDTGLSANGDSYGVVGLSTSSTPNVAAVFGYASAPSGYTNGVWGQSDSSTGGTGVFGFATATSGATTGVYGQSNSPDGIGVYGYAKASTGTTYGIYGSVDSSNGYAGSFTSGAGNGITISVPAGKIGLNVTSGQALVAGYTIWNAGNDGVASGLDADLLDGQQSSSYQARVLGTCPAGSAIRVIDAVGTVTCQTVAIASGSCAVGSTIRSINSDGSVICQVDAPLNRPVQPTNTTLTTLYGTGSVGQYTSITIGADGLPLISYLDVTNYNLRLAHCSDAACSSTSQGWLDTTGDVGYHTSIAIGADGLALISYYDATNTNLKVAHCSNTQCSTATVTTLDTTGNTGEYTSITIGADGLGLISYFDNTNDDLKVAHCLNTECTSAMLFALDTAGDVGRYTSITTGVDGLGLISYYNATGGDLRVAHCSNAACNAATISTVDTTGTNTGLYTSITIGIDGLGVISYFDNFYNSLRVGHCANTQCNSLASITADNSGMVGEYTSITIGADGLPLISYYDVTSTNLKVAHCADTHCTNATLTTLDSTGTVGLYSSITIGADGLPLMSYYDQTNGRLKVAHCSNAFCTPYFRRR